VLRPNTALNSINGSPNKHWHFVTWVLTCFISSFGWKWNINFCYSPHCVALVSTHFHRLTLLANVRALNVFCTKFNLNWSWFCNFELSFLKFGFERCTHHYSGVFSSPLIRETTEIVSQHPKTSTVKMVIHWVNVWPRPFHSKSFLNHMVSFHWIVSPHPPPLVQLSSNILNYGFFLWVGPHCHSKTCYIIIISFF
jgi:hypothetical protein